MQANDALWLMLMAFIVGILFFLIWFLSYSSLQQTYNVNGLNEANRLALYDSIDYASRGQRGVFYIDTQKYESDLQKLPIKRFDHKELNPGQNCTVLFLPDSKQTNKDGGSSNWADAYNLNGNSNYMHLDKAWQRASLSPTDINSAEIEQYVPIRGVLIATDFKDDSIGNGNYDSKLMAPSSIDDIFGAKNSTDPSLYVSAELINTYGRPIGNKKYNPYDTENDISR